MTASPPRRPAAAEPPAISGTFAREAPNETAFPAARVPAIAAFPARAALAAASSSFGVFVAWAIQILSSYVDYPGPDRVNKSVHGARPEKSDRGSQPPSGEECPG